MTTKYPFAALLGVLNQRYALLHRRRRLPPWLIAAVDDANHRAGDRLPLVVVECDGRLIGVVDLAYWDTITSPEREQS